jgi:acyl-coenzyme A thioesterase PaaI-like protein
MFPFDFMSNPRAAFGTLYLRYFGLAKIPLLFFVKPSVVEWTAERVVFKIPLMRRNRNHLGGMYFAVLAAGADLAAGFLAMEEIRKSGEPISLLFKNVQAEFLKRAEGDVLFTCEEGVLLADLVEKAIETGERVELAVTVVATVPSKLGAEPVARFILTLSLKRQEQKPGAEAPASEVAKA